MIPKPSARRRPTRDLPFRLRRAAALTVACLAASAPGGATADAAPRVVELFTSHGCSSCPPAEALFARLVEDEPGLVALEYHVDYWDALVHGADGSFADPFSSPAHTARQRRYAEAGLAGRVGVYTPQLVVDGRAALVGSDARRLRRALAAPRPDPTVSIRLVPDPSGRRLRAEIDASAADGSVDGAEIVLVRYLDEARTEITGGENRHRTAVNHRVVRAVEPLGGVPADGATRRVEFDAPADGEGCAVLVQDRALAALHGAALCPP